MANYATISAEMQAITRKAAEPWQPGDSVKVGISRAAHNLGLPFRRARTFWYGQTEAIWTVESDKLRAWHRRWLRLQRDRLASDLATLDNAIKEMDAG